MYMEVRRFRLRWLWLLLGVSALFAWWAFIQQVVLNIPFGPSPMSDGQVWLLLLLLGVGLPLLFSQLKLVVLTDNEGLKVGFVPFTLWAIPYATIDQAEQRNYSVLRYGGWGFRYSFARGWAFSVDSGPGVYLELSTGQRLLIGASEPEELLQAIKAHTPNRR